MSKEKFSKEDNEQIRKMYKKDNEKILVNPQLVRETQQLMYAQKRRKKTPLFKISVASVMAAVVCLCVFGNVFRPQTPANTDKTPKVANAFSVTAYAVEQENGKFSEKKIEFNQIIEEQIRQSFLNTAVEVDGNNNVVVYENIGFKCDGENIKEVKFSVDKGYFNKMVAEYAEKVDGEFKTELDVVKNEGDMKPYTCVSLEKMGNEYTISGEDLTENNFIIWGFDAGQAEFTVEGAKDYAFSVPKIDINVTVEFMDGEVQRKAITYETDKGTLFLS